MKTSPRLALAALCAAGLLTARAATAAPESSPEPPHAPLTPEISAEQFATRNAHLASEDLQGRESGTPGGRAAEEYVAAELARMGLEPCGEGGTAFQQAPMPWRPVIDGDCWFEIRREGEEPWRIGTGDGAVPFSAARPGEVAAGVVFAGYGISSPADGYDDWAGLDAAGKVAIVLRHGPREDVRESPWFLRKADQARMAQMGFAEKARSAAKAGAVAVLFVNDRHHKDGALPTTSPGDDIPVPAMAIPRAAANRLLRGVGKEIADLEAAIDRDLAPRSCDVPGVTAAFRAELGTASARNVLFRLPGADPALSHEVVVLSAHTDHVGLGWFGSGAGAAGRGQVHNGADDNASGTAAMLEAAEALAAGPAPRRTVLFAGWCGEEKGLVGSQYWCDHPTVPLANVVANVNLDMVGRYRDRADDDLGLGCAGAPTGEGFAALADALAKRHELRLRHTWDAWEQSDHFSFYRRKVPVLFLHTGLHPDYHKPADDWWKLDAKDAARIARLAADLVRAVADMDRRPEFREKPKRAVLGVNLGDAEADGGAVLGLVYPGLAAAKAGLQANDVIVAVGGRKVRNSLELSQILGERKPDETVDVTFRRGSETKTVKVTLSAR